MLLRAKKIDATEGAIVPQMITYIIPLVLSTLVQSLFNAMDLAVLGRMADTTAVASVGAPSTVIHVVVDAFLGFSSGAKLVLSRLIGKNDERELRKTVDTSLIMAILFGLLVAMFGIFFSPVMLRLLGCPSECFDGAVLYMTIYLMAAPAMLLYNYGSSILIASGDSHRPLIYVFIGGLFNVVLNVVLCLILPQKVLAVALATISSHILSAALVMIRLLRMDHTMRVKLNQIRFHWKAFCMLMRYGMPLALQNLLYPLSSLQISHAVNSYGVACVAGNSAATYVESIASAFRGAFGTSVATFMGQNLGAEKHDRVRKSFWYHLWIGMAVCVSLGFLVIGVGPILAGLFLGNDAVAIEYTMTRVRILMLVQASGVLMVVLGHAIQAFGYPFISTLNALVWVLGFRVFWMNVIYPIAPSYALLIWCFAVSWTCTAICNIWISSVLFSRYRKGVYRRI